MPDLTKVTWPLNVALAGVVFSIFSLINDTHYIYYGFITVLFGVTGHFIDQIFAFWLVNKRWRFPVLFILQALLIIGWVVSLIWIYQF
jgi:hypothetical protein